MTRTNLSSHEFNQDTSEDSHQGQPAQESLTINKQIGIADLLSIPNVADIDFEPQPLRGKQYNPADLV